MTTASSLPPFQFSDLMSSESTPPFQFPKPTAISPSSGGDVTRWGDAAGLDGSEEVDWMMERETQRRPELGDCDRASARGTEGVELYDSVLSGEGKEEGEGVPASDFQPRKKTLCYPPRSSHKDACRRPRTDTSDPQGNPTTGIPVRVIVGCCEGLVLLLLGAWYRPFVLNPRTGTMHQVAVEDRHSFRRTYAIGWMVLGGVRCHVVLRCVPGSMQYIDVYNLRTLTWTRRNTNGVTTAVVTSWESSAFVGGIFLWLGRFENRAAVVIYNGTNDGVSYFHVSPPLPRGLEVTISNLGDACAALWDKTADRRCFWIVKIEENALERTAVSGARSRFQPLALIPDSGHWILLSETVRLVLYNFSTHRASTLDIAEHPFINLGESLPEDIILAISFTESFHSPGRIDAGLIQD